jgi:hypothetical protein
LVIFDVMRFACLVFIAACAERQPTFVATVEPPPPPSPVASTPHHAMPPMTCGEAALERARLVAIGKGQNHPDVKAIEARLAQCQDTTPTASECLVVEQERVDLAARGYASRHPDMLANDAKRALCP